MSRSGLGEAISQTLSIAEGNEDVEEDPSERKQDEPFDKPWEEFSGPSEEVEHCPSTK